MATNGFNHKGAKNNKDLISRYFFIYLRNLKRFATKDFEINPSRRFFWAENLIFPSDVLQKKYITDELNISKGKENQNQGKYFSIR